MRRDSMSTENHKIYDNYFVNNVACKKKYFAGKTDIIKNCFFKLF